MKEKEGVWRRLVRVSPWLFTATSSPKFMEKPPWTPPAPGWGLVPQWGWGDPRLPGWWQRSCEWERRERAGARRRWEKGTWGGVKGVWWGQAGGEPWQWDGDGLGGQSCHCNPCVSP